MCYLMGHTTFLDCFRNSMDGTGDTPTARAGATPICTLAANEVASVRYVVYMEGCDANCIGEAQSKAVSLQFAFAGAKA